MKVLLCLFVTMLGVSLQAEDLSKHVVLKHYLGKWTASGELKGTDGNTLTVSESWEGKCDGDNSFTVEGTRTLNNDTQPFKWAFSINPSTGTCEAVLTGGDGAQPLRFEVNISEVNLTLDMKAQTGPTAAITVNESFKDEKHDQIDAKVTFTDDSGKTTLEGTIVHKKQAKP